MSSARANTNTNTNTKKLRNHLVWLWIRALVGVFTGLPFGVSVLLGRALGVLAYVLLWGPRRRVRARLCVGLGQTGGMERRVVRAFVTMGALLADTLALLRDRGREPASRRLSMDERSVAVLREALREGRGVVFVAAHLGPWERMAALLVEHGFPMAPVAREGFDPRMTRLYERIREPRGVRSIFRGRAELPIAIVRELAAGRVVGFLLDLPARVASTEMPLFGEAMQMPVGAARIALARRAAVPVVVGTCIPVLDREGGLLDSPAAAVCIERIDCSDLRRSPEDERVLLERIARVLDARIRRWPEAWLGLFAAPRSREGS